MSKKTILSKKLFIESIEKIKEQEKHDDKHAELLGQLYKDVFVAGLLYDNSFIKDQLLKILKQLMNDDVKHSWIEYFIYELNYGKNNGNNSAWRKDKSVIDLSSADKLYDFLLEKINNKK